MPTLPATISKALAEIGYNVFERQDQYGLLMRHVDSNEYCEHLLRIIYSRSQTGEWVQAAYGLLNRGAHDFAVKFLSENGSELFNKVGFVQTSVCAMSFTVMFDQGGVSTATIRNRDQTQERFAQILGTQFRDFLLPVVTSVRSPGDFVAFLLGNDVGHLWIESNAVLRAAEILYICRRYELPVAEVVDALGERKELFEAGLGPNPRIGPNDVIGRIVEACKKERLH